jgi:hypothetical protein
MNIACLWKTRLVSHHHSRRTVAGTHDTLDVAILMDRLAVFIGVQIDREIDWLSANCTGYFLERVTTHETPP